VDVFNPLIFITKDPPTQLVHAGELATFAITVTNFGDITLTNITVSDPIVPNCDAQLGTLSPFASASYQCDTVATDDFSNTATVTGEDPNGGLVQASDSATVDVFPTTYIYDDQPLSPIAINFSTDCLDGAITRTFSVAENFIIGDVKFGLNVDHAARGDLWGTLLSPAGTLVQLFDDLTRDDSNDNFDILFDEASTNPLNDGDDDDTAEPYYERTVQPYRSLSVFQGEQAQGTWTFEFCDNYPIIDYGAYNRSRLILEDIALTAGKSASALKVLPGDILTYTIPIANYSSVGLTNISLSDTIPGGLSYRPGSLSATTGAALEASGLITWTGDLAAQEVATITFSTDVVATTPGLITNTAAISHTFLMSPLTPQTVSQVFTDQDHFYTNETEIAIPDGGDTEGCLATISSTIDVPDDFYIGDVRVGVTVDHTFRGDLVIKLESPSGTVVGLLDNTGFGVNLDGLFTDSASDESFRLGDHDISAPYYDVLGQPQGTEVSPLSAFDGEKSQGVWTLHVCDDMLRDIGSLRQWTLFFEEANVWLGYDTSWATASNWSLGTVPITTELAYILSAPVGGNFPVLDIPASVGSLMVDPGASVNFAALNMTAEEYVNNRGTFTQTLPVTITSSGVAFLHITDQAGTNDKYFGVVITPTVGSMGDVLVGLRGKQANGCTAVPTDAILSRCYEIRPTLVNTATIQYYFSEAERNYQNASALKVWDRGVPPSHWLQVGTNYQYSESGAVCSSNDEIGCWVRADDINRYPPFVLGSATPPTITISQTLSSDLRLSWSHSESGVDHYEVWRMENQPYFTPNDPGSTKLADIAPSANHTYVYTDTTSGVGNVNSNSFYVVRSVYATSLLTTDANRVGEFDMDLLPDAANTIALPLSDSSLLTADDLGAATGASVVSRWVASTQSFDSRIVDVAGVNFPLSPGEGYFIDLPSDGASMFTTVGRVPYAGSIHFPITRGASCQLNLLSLPFDHAGLSTADELANAIGGIPVISMWRADTGSFDSLIVGVSGNNFATYIGYPYWPCADTSAGNTLWP